MQKNINKHCAITNQVASDGTCEAEDKLVLVKQKTSWPISKMYFKLSYWPQIIPLRPKLVSSTCRRVPSVKDLLIHHSIKHSYQYIVKYS